MKAPAIDWTPQRGALGSYRVGHSQPPHPADGLTATVDCGGGAFSTILNPQSFEDGGLIWCLTWWQNKDALAGSAASALSSFDYLLSQDITTKEAIERLRILRRARAALSPCEGAE